MGIEAIHNILRVARHRSAQDDQDYQELLPYLIFLDYWTRVGGLKGAKRAKRAKIDTPLIGPVALAPRGGRALKEMLKVE